MALTWSVTIIPVKISPKVVNISATVSDDTPGVADVLVHSRRMPFDTQQQQQFALDHLYAKYLAMATKSTQISTWLDGKEAAAKTYLEAK